ncbi:MAG: DctP family TRAP transporter solute-binding subunit [Enterobacteriaceae bacterium]
MKNKLVLSALFSTLFLLSTQATALTLKLAHAAPDSDLQQELSLYFKQEVEARSKGDIKVAIFPQGQLGNDKQMIDGTRSGIIDINMVGLNNWTGLLPEAAAFELPFVFTSHQSAFGALDGEPGQKVLEDLQQFGVKGLGYPDNGFRNITNNSKPIKEPGDLKGLRMRVNNSKALNDMFNLLDANPQQLPIAELYTALETGVVNAQDHPIGVTLSFKLYEVQKYFSKTQHAYSPLVLTMNLKKFNKLTPEQQQIITEVSKEAIAKQRESSIRKEDDMIAQLQKAGMQVNQDVDSAAFQAAAKPVWTAFIKENGDQLIEQIMALQK